MGPTPPAASVGEGAVSQRSRARPGAATDTYTVIEQSMADRVISEPSSHNQAGSDAPEGAWLVQRKRSGEAPAAPGKEAPGLGDGAGVTSAKGLCSAERSIDSVSTASTLTDGEVATVTSEEGGCTGDNEEDGEESEVETEGESEGESEENEEDEEDGFCRVGQEASRTRGSRVGGASRHRARQPDAAAASTDAMLELIRREGSPAGPNIVTPLAKIFARLASLGNRPQRSTCFHAVCAPQISIDDYLARIARYFHCSDECFVVALMYIDRLVKLHPDFVVSSLNVHRLLVTAITLAAKFHDDVFYSNKYYAQVGGVRLKEFNVLESTFLKMIGWSLHVLPEEYDQYLSRVRQAA
mmetsp:Transcript_55346/g.177491  ORF Transcript_55346/g.177491 Transcript_55346/m.177491 type:complete len:355 (-) Transcript_55346:131-1195(-)